MRESLDVAVRLMAVALVRAASMFFLAREKPKFSWTAATLLLLFALPSTAQPQTRFIAQMPMALAFRTRAAVQETAGSEDDKERLSEQAQHALETRRWPEAAVALEKLAQLAPSIPEIQANLGMAYYFQGRPAEALASFDRALKIKPLMPQATIMTGICEAELGRNANAIAILAPAFPKTTDPEVEHLIAFHLLHAYSELKQYDKAVAVAEALLKRHPDDPEVLFEVSRLYADRSYEVMARLMKSAPDSPWVHYAKAQVQESLARYDVARQEYEIVLKQQPTMPGAHYRLGLAILLGASRTPESLEEARHAFQEELAISPRNPNAEYELGEIDREQGNNDSALDHLSRAVAQQPDFVQARIALGLTLLKVGQTAQAVPQFKEAARLEPQNRVPHVLLARAYRSLGESAASEAEMAAYRKLHETDGETPLPVAGVTTAQQIDP